MADYCRASNDSESGSASRSSSSSLWSLLAEFPQAPSSTRKSMGLQTLTRPRPPPLDLRDIGTPKMGSSSSLPYRHSSSMTASPASISSITRSTPSVFDESALSSYVDMSRPISRWSDDSSIAPSSPLYSATPISPAFSPHGYYGSRPTTSRRPSVSICLSPRSQLPEPSMGFQRLADERTLSKYTTSPARGSENMIDAVQPNSPKPRDPIQEVKWQFRRWPGFPTRV